MDNKSIINYLTYGILNMKIDRLNRGTGGVYLISGINHDEVRAKAKEIKAEIDYMQSPSISERVQNTGELLCEVKYYGLD
jgi:hypothetical protein